LIIVDATLQSRRTVHWQFPVERPRLLENVPEKKL
jgi:hypothetical protein